MENSKKGSLRVVKGECDSEPNNTEGEVWDV
jgi:hypothetical protein